MSDCGDLHCRGLLAGNLNHELDHFQPPSCSLMEGMADIPLSQQTTTQPQVRRPEPMGRADLLQVQDALRDAGPISRDFEQAIVDDDRSAHDIDCVVRGLSGSLHRGRRRSRNQQQDIAARSREGSTSERSSSPPNSVEAFADPRRRERANTLESYAASDIDAIRQHTVSGGSLHRRPTCSNASLIRPDQGEVRIEVGDNTAAHQYEELGRIPVIDYEELEEFVALTRQPKTTSTSRRKNSLSSQSRNQRFFHDLRPRNQVPPVLQIVMHTSSPERSSISESSSGHAVKGNEWCGKTVNEKGLLDSLQNENEPTRFRFFSSECQSTVHAAELGDLVLPGDTFRDLFELGPEGGVWWLDVVDPTEAELGALSRAFSIHPLTAEDIMTQEAREKVELFKQYYFVCFRTFYQMDKTSERFLEPVNLYMVVYRDGVLTFSFSENPHAANVRKRIGKLRDYVSLSSDWICYAMM